MIYGVQIGQDLQMCPRPYDRHARITELETHFVLLFPTSAMEETALQKLFGFIKDHPESSLI